MSPTAPRPALNRKKIRPTVVIVGRINVGKSSLFNRLTERNKAIVSALAGTTRDYNIGQVSWRKKTFNLIDTGGVNTANLKHSIQALVSKKIANKIKAVEEIESAIIHQTKKALAKADLVLLVVDGQAGLLPEDRELALVLKKLNLPILLVCNKIDSQRWRDQTSEFFQLSLGQPLAVSAANGSGSGDLLDVITAKIPGQPGRPKTTPLPPPIKIALIGKPNAGKSLLLNKIVGEDRVIVSKVPQTTRDPQEIELYYQDQKIVLIDTAGLRRKAGTDTGIEKIANARTVATIKKADLVLFLTEADKKLTSQDNRLAGLLKDSRGSIIVLANKWDLLEGKDPNIDKKMKDYYQASLPFLSFAPLLFVSAKTGRNIDKIMDLILEINRERNKRIEDKILNQVLKSAIRHHLPVQAKTAKHPFIYSLEQTRIRPPEFKLTIGLDDTIHFSYLRFLENQIRKNFGFLGTPIEIRISKLKKKKL